MPYKTNQALTSIEKAIRLPKGINHKYMKYSV